MILLFALYLSIGYLMGVRVVDNVASDLEHGRVGPVEAVAMVLVIAVCWLPFIAMCHVGGRDSWEAQ